MEVRTPPVLPVWFHRGLAVAWIALLWVPLVQMVYRPVPEGPATIENRRKAVMPDLRGRSLKALTAFTKAFEKFFSDAFGFRDGLIRTHTLLHVRGLQTSPLATIVMGRDNWLYYNNAADGMNLVDYCGLAPFSEKELDAIEHSLASTSDELRRRGIAFAVLVAPNKHTVYPEHLPERIRKLAGTTRLDQLAGRLGRRPDILFVDVRRALLEKKAQRPLYFRTDTHWNSYGAHIVAQRLLKVLADAGAPVTPPRDENLVLELRERPQTDLTNLLGLPGDGREQDFLLRDRTAQEGAVTVLPLQKGQAANHPTRTCETGKAGTRFLLIQDSFGNALSPSLCREFAYGVSAWDTRIREETLEQHQPAVVILEVVERYSKALASPMVWSDTD